MVLKMMAATYADNTEDFQTKSYNVWKWAKMSNKAIAIHVITEKNTM